MKSIFAAHVILTMSGFQHLYHSRSNGLSFDILRLQYTFYSTHEICTYVTLVCTVKNVLQMTVHLMCYDTNAESQRLLKWQVLQILIGTGPFIMKCFNISAVLDSSKQTNKVHFHSRFTWYVLRKIIAFIWYIIVNMCLPMLRP